MMVEVRSSNDTFKINMILTHRLLKFRNLVWLEHLNGEK